MRSHPASNISEIVLKGAGIEDVVGGVAGIDGAIDIVGLALDHADTVVELGDDRVGLVGSGVVGADEGGVVGADFGEGHVLAGTEFGVIVAGLGVCGRGAGGGG